MNEEIKAAWVSALRSGEYEQGAGQLRGSDDKFCCLGVLCDLAEKAGIVQARPFDNCWDYGGATGYTPAVVKDWAGLPGDGDGDGILEIERTLAEMNDSGNDGFAAIADRIEAEL